MTMKKINKSTARKLWNEKKPFLIVACNMRPEYGILIGATGHTYEECETIFHETFETMYNSFCYYNCNSVTGRYPAFYLPEE